MGELRWWDFPRDEARVPDMLEGMEEAARWLDTQSSYSGSNRSFWMAGAAKEVRARMDMVKQGKP